MRRGVVAYLEFTLKICLANCVGLRVAPAQGAVPSRTASDVDKRHWHSLARRALICPR